MTDRGRAIAVLTASTLAFTVCFAVWMMYGVLITFLVDQQVFSFTGTQMGWLIGIPVLTGAAFRLPAGMLSDRWGGRPVFVAVMLLAAAASYLTSYAGTFWAFFMGGLGFGVAGASFAVGVAYTSVWFPQERQGVDHLFVGHELGPHRDEIGWGLRTRCEGADVVGDDVGRRVRCIRADVGADVV